MRNKTRIRAWLVLGVLGLCLSVVGFRLHWLDSPQGRETLAGGFVDQKMLGLMNRLLAKGVFRIRESGAVVVKAALLEGEISSPQLRAKVRRYAGAAWLRPGAKSFDPRLFKVSAPRQWAGKTLMLKGRILDRQGRALAYSELLPQGLKQKRRYPPGRCRQSGGGLFPSGLRAGGAGSGPGQQPGAAGRPRCDPGREAGEAEQGRGCAPHPGRQDAAGGLPRA